MLQHLLHLTIYMKNRQIGIKINKLWKYDGETHLNQKCKISCNITGTCPYSLNFYLEASWKWRNSGKKNLKILLYMSLPKSLLANPSAILHPCKMEAP